MFSGGEKNFILNSVIGSSSNTTLAEKSQFRLFLWSFTLSVHKGSVFSARIIDLFAPLEISCSRIILPIVEFLTGRADWAP
jgi:hypothetical protein